MNAAANSKNPALAKSVGSYHHGDLRGALIQASLEILRSDGIHKLSLREAARAVGVSQAAPYRHFENKEALIAAIAQEGFVMLGNRLRSAAQEFLSDAEELFHQAAQAYLNLTLERPDHFRLMFGAVFPFLPGRHPDLDLASREVFNELNQIVARCQEQRILRAGETELLTLTAWSGFHGLSSLLVNRSVEFLATPRSEVELMMRTLSRNLLEGLKSD